MKNVNWVISDNTITVNYNGQTHMVSRTDALASKLILAIKNKTYDEIPNLVSAAKRIEKFSDGKFFVKDGQVFVNDQPVCDFLSNKIVKFANEGLPCEPLVKFAANLQLNPSYRAVQELYQFLEKNDHPITENGCFIAYKKVKEDFMDVHSGTFDNSPGKVVSMPRNQVNEDCNQTCSYGLHVANWDYADKFYTGGIMLEVEVNPADVVSIPVDYNQAKMRTCAYKVLGVVDHEHSLGTSLRVITPKSDVDDEHCDCRDCCVTDDCDADDEEYPYDDELAY
jgi:hypothetical protein